MLEMRRKLAKTSGTVFTRDREKIGQQLTGADPESIPQTIAGHILAPLPFSCERKQNIETNRIVGRIKHDVHKVGFHFRHQCPSKTAPHK